MALLASGLLPASFRGVPFGVFADEIGGGRRVAVHQYPGREEPWAEDMGRGARSFRFRGFIVDGDVAFAGGPIQLQRALLIAALEKAGPGLLIHPTLGPVQVSVPRFSVGADLGAGKLSTIDLEFVEAGKRTYPSLLTKSSGLLTASNLMKAAIAVDGIRAIALAARAGGRHSELAIVGGTWSDRVRSLGEDATALHRLAAQLPGSYGRFAGGGNQGVDGRVIAAEQTLPDLVATASADRVEIAAALARLDAGIAIADLSDPVTLPDLVQAVVDALAAACADPADAIRLLVQLLIFGPTRPEAGTAIGAAVCAMFRRAAVARLVIVAGTYQPSSSDDASALILMLGDLLAIVADVAADAGEDESFRAARAARAAIVQDLRSRGATLPKVRAFTMHAALPSLALAQRFYRDAARAAQLEEQAAPVHPLFMPARFTALAA